MPGSPLYGPTLTGGNRFSILGQGGAIAPQPHLPLSPAFNEGQVSDELTNMQQQGTMYQPPPAPLPPVDPNGADAVQLQGAQQKSMGDTMQEIIGNLKRPTMFSVMHGNDPVRDNPYRARGEASRDTLYDLPGAQAQKNQQQMMQYGQALQGYNLAKNQTQNANIEAARNVAEAKSSATQHQTDAANKLALFNAQIGEKIREYEGKLADTKLARQDRATLEQQLNEYRHMARMSEIDENRATQAPAGVFKVPNSGELGGYTRDRASLQAMQRAMSLMQKNPNIGSLVNALQFASDGHGGGGFTIGVQSPEAMELNDLANFVHHNVIQDDQRRTGAGAVTMLSNMLPRAGKPLDLSMREMHDHLMPQVQQRVTNFENTHPGLQVDEKGIVTLSPEWQRYMNNISTVQQSRGQEIDFPHGDNVGTEPRPKQKPNANGSGTVPRGASPAALRAYEFLRKDPETTPQQKEAFVAAHPGFRFP